MRVERRTETHAVQCFQRAIPGRDGSFDCVGTRSVSRRLSTLNSQLSTFPKLPDAAEFLVALAEEFFEGELGEFVEVAGDGVL